MTDKVKQMRKKKRRHRRHVNEQNLTKMSQEARRHTTTTPLTMICDGEPTEDHTLWIKEIEQFSTNKFKTAEE